MPSRARPKSYDQVKEFQGKRYTGMKVGRKHGWKYDAGEWTEKKVTPDKWEFSYSAVKRRAGKAPEGSGAPVGTAYRWYILANQVVTKIDANSYTTEMVGVKYKLAHKRAEKERWSASEKAQRKALVKLLHEMIAELEAPPAETATTTDIDSAPPDGAAEHAGGNGHDGAVGRDSAGGEDRATHHTRPIPQARKRGTTHHHPRASGAQRRTARAARRSAPR